MTEAHLAQLDDLCAQLTPPPPRSPRYSLFRAGPLTDDVLAHTRELLRYGLRVFLVITEERDLEGDPQLRPFLLNRLLELEVVNPAVMGPPPARWCLDGDLDDESERWLSAADEPHRGGINSKQLLVVHAPPDQDIEVQAGAGTGKTETMIERIIFLRSTLHADLNLSQIGMVTFTKEAAKQMRERLIKSLNVRQRLCDRPMHPYLSWMSAVASMPISTIHSFSRALISLRGSHIGLTHEVKVGELKVARNAIVREELCRHFSGDRLDEWLNEQPLFEWEALTHKALDLLAKGGVSLSEHTPSPLEWGEQINNLESARSALHQELFRELIPRVIQRLAALRDEEQALSMNDLTPMALEALTAGGPLGVSALRYLFIDEFQDTDTLQMELFQAYCQRSSCRLFYVGDKKQAIYRFRGAYGDAFEAMQALQSARGALTPPFALTRNFRTGEELLSSLDPHFSRWGSAEIESSGGARYLDYSAKDRLLPAPFARAQRDESQALTWHHLGSFDEDAALNQLTRDVKRLQEEQVKHIAILVRANYEAYAIKEHLKAEGLECALMTGGDFFQSRPVRELRSLLSAVVNPTDSTAFDLLSTAWAPPLIAESDVVAQGEPLGDAPRRQATTLYGWAQRLQLRYGPRGAVNNDLTPLKAHLRDLRSRSRQTSAIAFIGDCFERYEPSRYLPHEVPGEMSEEEIKTYERSVDLLLTKLVEAFGEASVSLHGVLEWLRLKIATDQSVDRPTAHEEGADLSERPLLAAITVHRAKGQEYEAVIIPFTQREFVRDGDDQLELIVEHCAPRRAHWRRGSLGNRFPQQTPWERHAIETIKEETRLLYVAMTRARRRLIIYTSESRRRDSWSRLLSAAARRP